MSRLFSVAAFAAALLSCASLSGQIAVDSFDGPLTANEISTFKSYINTVQPIVWTNTANMANEYAQGHSGETIKALGLMYEITGDTAILDRMIYFCDVLLSERNDILPAPYGQHVMWTGTVTHDWISSQTDPDATGNAPAGDGAGHLAYCARLILQHTALLNQAVPQGDIYGHGATYGQRAATFIAEADDVYSSTVFPYYLNLASGNLMYFAANERYKPGDTVPWNQQMMFTYGMQNLAAAHAILGDNPALVSQYDGILQANLNWFFNSTTTKQTYTDAAGNSAYDWAYDPTGNSGEDSNHAALDVAGYFRAYQLNRYGITAAQMQPFANMYVDVMHLGPKFFAGRVNGTNGTGHGSPTPYARSANLVLADLRPDKYYDLVSTGLTSGGTTTSLDTFSRFAWVKNRRALAGFAVGFLPAPGPFTTAQTVTLSTSISGGSIRYTTDGSTPSPTVGLLYSAPFTVSATTTIKAISYKTGVPNSPVSTATYTIWALQPTFSPAAGSYSGSQAVTMTSATSGATIRYTIDGTTPTPTHGTLYAGAVTVAATTTLRAIAYTGSLSSSTVTSGVYTIGPFAAAPTFTPAGGTYATAQNVTMATATSGASIHYTTDGTVPSDTVGTLYSGPVTLTASTTLQAVAYKTGVANSAVTNQGYNIGAAAGTPTFSPAGGTYAAGQTVTLNTTTPGGTIYFTTDGTSPTSTSGMVYIYTGPFTVGKNTTVQAYTGAANTTSSTVASATYAIRAATPTFSPAGGTYSNSVTVTLSSATSGASIRYTTDGSTPTSTTGTLYSGALTVSANATLKAIAYASGFTDSNVASATYVISALGGPVKAAVTSANVTASGNASTYVPANSVDGSLATRWAASGDGVWIRYDLGAVQTVSYVKLGWYSGTSRTYTFDVQVSNDDATWITVINRQTSSGTTNSLETYDFADVSARYVRVVGHLSSVDAYTNVTEAEIWISPSKFSVGSAAVTASAYTSTYVPANTVDGSLATRWAGNGDGVWIRYDLGASKTVSSVKLGWFSGTARVYTFDVQLSTDGTTWTTVLNHQTSSGTTTALETYDFADAAARYVRVVGHQNTVDTYTNVTEAEIWGF
jgi:hypothetical protein